MRLVIEVDGSVHNYEKQQEYDWLREKEIKRLKIKVIRYTNNEIENNLDQVIKQLKIDCNRLKQGTF